MQAGADADDAVEVDMRELDKFLPIANISRIMKKALPQNAKIAKDAKETVQVEKRSCVVGWCLTLTLPLRRPSSRVSCAMETGVRVRVHQLYH
jgi:hypothetical protein